MMKNEIAVKLQNVSKYYKLYDSPKDRLKEALHPFRRKYHKDFFALNNISFELRKGECLGVIGKNGMGKSTLLKIIANVIQPSSGIVQVNGSVSALLELGTGFNPEFSGFENIYFYGTILGFGKNEIEGKVKEIVDFADIGDFINQPVKTYSSGMFVRLAFAVQTSLQPDILLVDEVLSVGDIFFQQKCHSRIEELLKMGTSIILVSHDLLTIQKYSSNTALINRGNLEFFGNSLEAIHIYYNDEYKGKWESTKINEEKTSKCENETSKIRSVDIELPSKENYLDLLGIKYDSTFAELKKIAVCDNLNIKRKRFEIGEEINVFYEIYYKLDIEIPVGAVTITNSSNIIIHGKDTLQYKNMKRNDNLKIRGCRYVLFKQSFKLDLALGLYTFSIGIGHTSIENYEKLCNTNYIERDKYIRGIVSIPNISSFEIISGTEDNSFPFHGLVGLDGTSEINVI